ncbi:hypothetical protein K0U83_22710 [bacterium]|nr:hypothetical protein [bacterium]
MTDSNQEWMRRREAVEKSLREDQRQIEDLVSVLGERLQVRFLTGSRPFGKVTVTTIVRDGLITGLEWSIHGTIRS